jgi:hypothetical protein
MKNKNFDKGKNSCFFKNKKAIIDDMMFWIFRIILIMIITFALVFFVNSMIKKNLDSGKLELNLIAARIINSPECLAMSEKVDKNIRIFPGKTRLKNFDENFLKKNCIITDGDARVGVNMTLYAKNDKKSVYINQQYYEDIEPLTFSAKYLKVRRVFPVLVYDESGKAESTAIEIIAVEKKR